MAGLPLEPGQKASRSLSLTPEHVRTFAELSGDYNPLHFDADFAARTPFGRLVVQGGLTTGLLHALVAMDMPGPGTVFLSQDWKFTAPVFVGDTPRFDVSPPRHYGWWVVQVGDRDDGMPPAHKRVPHVGHVHPALLEMGLLPGLYERR